MKSAFCWFAWGIISFWALKTFYFSFSREKLERLRKAMFGINLAVLVLTFLPWLPATLSGKSALALALEGNVLTLLFIILLLAPIASLLIRKTAAVKLAAITTIVNTILLFILMFQLRPGTFVLTFFDMAPIVAFLFLLIDDVVVLLLWQQLQLKEKK